MHPLEALGLARDADERAVKRAYAQRLKTTRPDDDPAGFQALHETYQSALSYVRWRAENPENEDEFDEDDDDLPLDEEQPSTAMSSAEFEALIGNPRYRDEPAPAAETEAPRPPPDVQRVTEMPEPFRLDVRDFLKSLFAQTDDLDETRLRSWLTRETAHWPLVVMPRVAHDVLAHMVEHEPGLTAEQLEVIIAQFGLDDVLSGANPMDVQQLRIAAAGQLRKRRAKFAHLFQPGNRGELARYMSMPEQGGGHPEFFTRFVMFLLTNARAYEWAFALRPVPFLNRLVMRFLRDVDQGRFEAFASHLDGMALSFWEWAEMRREANRGFRYVIVIVGLLAGLAYVTRDAPGTPSPVATGRPGRAAQDQRAREAEFGERFRRIVDMGNEEAVPAYDGLIRDLPVRSASAALEELAALARYNRGVVLRNLGRLDEAKAACEEVDRIFTGSNRRPTQLAVARALVNLARLQADQGSQEEVIVTLEKVLARYDRIRNERFDLQIAKAFSGRAAAFRALDRRDEALHAYYEILRRFGDKRDGELGEIVTRVRSRREELGRREGGAGAPAEAPPTLSRD